MIDQTLLLSAEIHKDLLEARVTDKVILEFEFAFDSIHLGEQERPGQRCVQDLVRDHRQVDVF